MAHNKIEDLRDHLFAALERFNDEEMTPEQLQMECEKAKAVASLANVLATTAKLELDFMKATGAVGTGSQFFKGINTQKQLT